MHTNWWHLFSVQDYQVILNDVVQSLSIQVSPIATGNGSASIGAAPQLNSQLEFWLPRTEVSVTVYTESLSVWLYDGGIDASKKKAKAAVYVLTLSNTLI